MSRRRGEDMDMEMLRYNVTSVKVRLSTFAALEKQADEEGVTIPALVRRALDEWLEIVEVQAERFGGIQEVNGPMEWLPTVKISRRTRDALLKRGINFSVTVPRALDEWLLL